MRITQAARDNIHIIDIVKLLVHYNKNKTSVNDKLSDLS